MSYNRTHQKIRREIWLFGVSVYRHRNPTFPAFEPASGHTVCLWVFQARLLLSSIRFHVPALLPVPYILYYMPSAFLFFTSWFFFFYYIILEFKMSTFIIQDQTSKRSSSVNIHIQQKANCTFACCLIWLFQLGSNQ